MVVLLSLKSFFSSNRILAVAFSALMIVCLVGGLFGVNYVYCNVEVYNQYWSEQNTYTILNCGLETGESIKKFLEKYQDRFALVKGTFHEMINGEEAEICAIDFWHDDFEKMFVERGRMFSEEEVELGVQKIIMNSSDESIIGKKVQLDEEEFEVIGLGSENLIPYWSLKDTSKVENITLLSFTPFGTSKERELFIEDLSTIFGSEVVAPKGDTKTILSYVPMLLPTIILIIMGFINLSFLYVYFVQIRKRQYMIYRINGASQLKIFGIFIGETLILFSLAFLISVLLFKIIMMTCFSHVSSLLAIEAAGVEIKDNLKFLRLFSVYLILGIFFILSFIPTMIKMAKSDISNSREKK